jgi:LysR family cys regulon transcriptional activator
MARYVLPKIVEKFMRKYPAIRLGLRQGNPEQVCELLDKGQVDVGIGPETVREFPGLAAIECFSLSRSVVAKTGHPILKVPKLTLHEIAKHPIITYDPAYSGRWKVMEAFRKAHIEPNVVFGSVDADVSKTYVELGLGIAILTAITYDRRHDHALRARDASHLFEPSVAYVRLRANTYLRKYLLDFIHMVAPHVSEADIRSAVTRQARRAV